MALINTKFDLGDKVYLIRRERRKAWETCSFCAGSGDIIGRDGTIKACPICYRNRGEYAYYNMEWVVTGGYLTIGQVGYVYSRHESEERYMANETGVGSGSVYYACDLFESPSEAQAECDRRNAEEL